MKSNMIFYVGDRKAEQENEIWWSRKEQEGRNTKKAWSHLVRRSMSNPQDIYEINRDIPTSQCERLLSVLILVYKFPSSFSFAFKKVT